MSMHQEPATDVEAFVKARYSDAAREREEGLCCAVTYDKDLLAAIPQEVLERDYGCGDPTRYVKKGETVLDLGSGSGKHCFLVSQVVGAEGRVIGIDMNDDMLALARRAAPEVARRIGHGNVEFRKGRIQELDLDVEALDGRLAKSPIRSTADLQSLQSELAAARRASPLVADSSVDVVISNCVLNLVRPEDKPRVFKEVYRVLRNGGRAVISDIVSDEDVTEEMKRDPELWSGCISGALREDAFLRAFEDAGFHGIHVIVRNETPWRTVDGIEFRSVTVAAYKGKVGPCLEQRHAVIYRGPFKEVHDDDRHTFRRGEPIAVCEKTFRLLTSEPYLGHFAPVPPRDPVPLDQAPPFSCIGVRRRDPRETKGRDYRVTSSETPSACAPSPDGPCCA